MIFNLYAILKWFERTWRFWVALVFVFNMAYIIHNYRLATVSVQPKVIEPVQDKQDQLDMLVKRIDALEKRIEDQQKVISWYDTYNQSSQNNFKRLDKNQQTQIETLKRMCEYIWVITIDKKIVPRQCYPEYNWRREEVNGN